MKLIHLLTMCALSSGVLAQSGEKKSGNSDKIIGTSILGTAAVGAGTTSYLKFSGTNKLLEQNTENLIAHSGTGKVLSSEEISSSTSKIADGDKVIIKYHLNEAQNRQAWIDKYVNDASSSRSSASSYRSMAQAALFETQTVYDEKGNIVGTRPAPNYGSNVMYNSMAQSEEENAIKYLSKAEDVRHGAKVEWMELEKPFKGKATTKAIVSAELKGLLDDGGKVFSLSRVPGAVMKKVANGNVIGGVTAGVSLVSAGAAVYNQVTGKISGSLASKSSGRLNGDRNSGKDLSEQSSASGHNSSKGSQY